MIKKFNRSILALTMALSIGSAQASTVNFNATGDSAGPSLYVTGLFDNTGFTGLGTEQFNTTLTIYLDSSTFTEPSTQARIEFLDGMFFGFYYDGFDSSNSYYLQSVDNSFYLDHFFSQAGGLEDGFESWYGSWVSDSYTVVPIPAAVWLFGSGLIGLAGMARRKKA